MQPLTRKTWVDRLSIGLAALYVADRVLKLAAVVSFFRRPQWAMADSLTHWPAITLIQPITRGASNLAGALARRTQPDYPGAIDHLFICDQADAESQAVCRQWMAAHPEQTARIVAVAVVGTAIASKVQKLRAALPAAQGEVLCFIDDDILLRPGALRQLAGALQSGSTGATFGLACYTNWSNTASSLMSAFVNANALLSYIPLTYLTEPYTITGHLFALPRTVFAAAGGLDGLEEARIDDDHEIARRVRRLGVQCVQTPVIYDVDNCLPSLRSYANQMQRWFTIPRLAMLPFLTPREQAVSAVGSAANLLLPALALLMLLARRRTPVRALLSALAAFGATYLAGERLYLRRATPLARWPLVVAVAFVAPLQALIALAGGNEFEWRGQRLRLHRGGTIDFVAQKQGASEQAVPGKDTA